MLSFKQHSPKNFEHQSDAFAASHSGSMLWSFFKLFQVHPLGFFFAPARCCRCNLQQPPQAVPLRWCATCPASHLRSWNKCEIKPVPNIPTTQTQALYKFQHLWIWISGFHWNFKKKHITEPETWTTSRLRILHLVAKLGKKWRSQRFEQENNNVSKSCSTKSLSICTCPTPRFWRTFWSGGGFKSAGGFLLHAFNTQLDVKSTVHIHLKKWLQFLSAPDDIRQDHAKGHLALQGCQNIPTSTCSFAIFGTSAQAENFVWVQLCRWDQHTYDEQIQRHQESPTPRLFELYNSSFEREKRKQLTK